MMYTVCKRVHIELNDIERAIFKEAFELCPPSKFLGSSKDKYDRQFEKKAYRDDFMGLKEDIENYERYTHSTRFYHKKEMEDHNHNKGRGFNGKKVKLLEKDPDIILTVLEHYRKNKELGVKPDNLIDGVGQIYKQDVDKLYKEMLIVKDTMNLARIHGVDYA